MREASLGPPTPTSPAHPACPTPDTRLQTGALSVQTDFSPPSGQD